MVGGREQRKTEEDAGKFFLKEAPFFECRAKGSPREEFCSEKGFQAA